jgi:hypothetical protein
MLDRQWRRTHDARLLPGCLASHGIATTIGVSRLLDVEMRKIKPLQIARTLPSTLLIGSSVVYRGIDPRELAMDIGRPYNAGMSSLMADELPRLATFAADLDSTGRVVISLDYFMFSGLLPPRR